ncbi:phage tail protein [Dinghuibacter silviterrae]|uniref:Phage tail-like protein n=1 Tax=Dinghuibacter silviterrae TaxID=1539049 RepID=A0A4R8DSN8_9BACT|nr:phage tail protein [Dinghuibacter silviterrae]TDX01282.1 phage tail-like protein [Dinghuibacter silviterrae]
MADDSSTGFYPPLGFYFQVNIPGIQGINEGSFQEVSGLNIKLGKEDIKEGGENRFVHRLPSRPQYENLVLKRGMVTGSGLLDWIKAAAEEFTFTPKNVMVILMDNMSGSQLVSWQFNNAYPVSYQVSPFKSQEGAIVVETVELCYDYFQRMPS